MGVSNLLAEVVFKLNWGQLAPPARCQLGVRVGDLAEPAATVDSDVSNPSQPVLPPPWCRLAGGATVPAVQPFRLWSV